MLLTGFRPRTTGYFLLLVQEKVAKEKDPRALAALTRGPFRVLEKPGRSLTRIAQNTRNCLGQELALIPVFLRYSARG